MPVVVTKDGELAGITFGQKLTMNRTYPCSCSALLVDGVVLAHNDCRRHRAQVSER